MADIANIEVRDASARDVAAITEIYARHVLSGTASFEEMAPDENEMARRMGVVQAQGLPWLVAEMDGIVCGYCYAAPYHPRIGWRFTVEDAVYVADGMTGRGIGKALLAELTDRCAALGYRQMIAVIGDSENAGSIGLHRSLGFEHAGALKRTGFKFGRWIDVVLMQRELAPAES